MSNLKNKIIYSYKSKIDFIEIKNYLTSIGTLPKNILRIEKNIISTISKLVDFPKLGNICRISKLKQYRVLVINSYLVFYTINLNTIEIHRIIHGSQNYKNIL